MIDFLYPGGKPKALTFSYDDGAVFDRRLTELFRRCGLKGTFHLNSGRLGGHFGPMEYIRPDEVRELYRGQEVACHGVDHLFPDRLSPSGLAHELYGDRCALEQLTGAPVTGLSYAFGVTSDAVAAAAQAYGFEYARTVADTGIFAAPADFLRWHPTAHHAKLFADSHLTDLFLDPPPYLQPALFYIWGHSYEFELHEQWEDMERLCTRLSGRSDIWYATNLEICRYEKAKRALVYDTAGRCVYNPGCIPVWYRENGEIKTI